MSQPCNTVKGGLLQWLWDYRSCPRHGSSVGCSACARRESESLQVCLCILGVQMYVFTQGVPTNPMLLLEE